MAEENWERARDLAKTIRRSDPAYREVVSLEQTALDGLEKVMRAERATSWAAEARRALGERDFEAAAIAARQWQILVPDDPELVLFHNELREQHQLIPDAGAPPGQAMSAAVLSAQPPTEPPPPSLPDRRSDGADSVKPRRRRPIWALAVIAAVAILSIAALVIFLVAISEPSPTSTPIPSMVISAKGTNTASSPPVSGTATATVEIKPATTATATVTAEVKSTTLATATETAKVEPMTTATPSALPTATPPPRATPLPIALTVKLAGRQDYDLFLMDASGNNRRRLVARPGEDETYPRWSPDGKYLAFTRSDSASLVDSICLLRIQDFQLVDPLRPDDYIVCPDSSSNGSQGEWSPDGRNIVFRVPQDLGLEWWERVHDVWVLNTARNQSTQLTQHHMDDTLPAWSPDRDYIAFSTNRADGAWEIYIMNADGSNQRPLTVRTQDRDPAWSPDGKRIAFTSGRDGNFEIYVMNRDGSNQTRLTSDAAVDIDVNWTPDGRIMFASDRDGDMEIYIMKLDGSGLIQLTHNQDEDRWPSWRP